MIKFFRRIRQQLLSESKFSKYLVYALGEILLIMIGIFMALQLNNWNEQRKAKLESEALLQSLKIDLQGDIVFFESLKDEYMGWLTDIDQVMSFVLDSDDERITEGNQYTAGRMSMNFLQVNQITFSEMFNTGKELKFRNDSIITYIKAYFQYADIELQKLNSDNEIFFEWMLANSGKKGVNTSLRLSQGRNIENIDFSWRTKINSDEYMSYESNYLYYKHAIETNLDVIKDLQNRTQSLIQKISLELNQEQSN